MLINKERTVTQLGDSITNPTRPNINWMDVLNAWTIAHETLKNGSIASNGSSALLASALEVLEPLHLEQHLLDSFYEDVCHACRDVFANYSHVNIDSMGFQNLVNELSELLQKHLDSLKSFWPNPTRPTQILVTRFRAQVSASIPIHFHAAIREYLMSSIQTAGRRSLLDNEGRSGNLTERVRHKPEDTASIAQTDKRASPIPSTLFVTDTFAPSLSSRTLVSMSLDDVELDEWRVFVVKSGIDTDDVEHADNALSYQQGFVAMCKRMHNLGLSDLLFAEAETLLYTYVEEQAVSAIYFEDDFERAFLRPCLCWLQKAILPWVELLVGADVANLRTGMLILNQWRTRLSDHVYRVFCDALTRKLFVIIVAYPDSLPALEDLKVCLAKTDQKSIVGESFKTTTRARLLHHGAKTSDILMYYVSSIKCLELLDPSSQLTKVTDPIRDYLRGRDDAVRSIINILLEDAGKRMETDMPQGGWNDPCYDSGCFLTSLAFFFLNIDAHSNEEIARLIDIFENKEVFAREFQTMLMEKLLANTDYNFTNEVGA
ncbi:hypothetical protein SeLEV6574_g07739, partial [Synchytrium endobioticum]